MDKLLINIEIFEDREQGAVIAPADESIKYEGRCLGMVSDKEYNALVGDVALQRKLLTVETMPCSEITKIEVKDLKDLRLAVAVKKRGDIDVNIKKLFFTEPVELITSIGNLKDGDMNVSIKGMNDTHYLLVEKEV